jgi:AraC-like DNA-binding protein
VSFRTHVARVRMRRALEMLREGTLPVRDVANAVGYRQPAQFAKAFRRYQGVAPSDFRASGRGFARPAAPRFGRLDGRLLPDGRSPLEARLIGRRIGSAA